MIATHVQTNENKFEERRTFLLSLPNAKSLNLSSVDDLNIFLTFSVLIRSIQPFFISLFCPKAFRIVHYVELVGKLEQCGVEVNKFTRYQIRRWSAYIQCMEKWNKMKMIEMRMHEW